MTRIATLLTAIALVAGAASANLIDTEMAPGTLQNIADGEFGAEDSLNTWYTFSEGWSDATGVAVNQNGQSWTSAVIFIDAPAAGTEMNLSFDGAKGEIHYVALQGWTSRPVYGDSNPKVGNDVLGGAVTSGDEDIDVDSILITGHGPYNITMPAGYSYLGLYFRGQEGAQFDNVTLTPEPASLSVLGLGALALIRRRR